jgi:hypothetical protein
MTNLTLFLIEITLCVMLSLAVISLIKPYLSDVLAETCGTAKRAAFWVMFTQLMLVIAPLLLVVFFTDVRPGSPSYPAEAIKDTLFRSLLGIFIAIAMIGRVIWKSVAADLASDYAKSKHNDRPALESD